MKLTYRTLLPSDMQLVFEWNNDVQTRQSSFHTDTIHISQHKEWLKKKIMDSNAFYLIAKVHQTPIALVRYDISENSTTVGITISTEYRGKGLSSIILSETANMYFSKYKQPLFAYIKPDNIASIKSFEKANYIFLKEEIVLNQKAFLYQRVN